MVVYLGILPLANGGLQGDQPLFHKFPKYPPSQLPLFINMLKSSRS